MTFPTTAKDQHQAAFHWDEYATRYVFLVLGIAVSVWAVLVPFAKARLQVNDAELGGLLLLIGTGALLSMLCAGWLTNGFGCRKTLCLSTAVFLCSLVALAFTSDVFLFAVTLFIFGVSSGIVDIAMNIQASLVEKHSGRRLMSGFHGMYSVGGFLGALIVSMMLKAGLSLLSATAILSGLMFLVLAFIFQQHLYPFGIQEEKSAFSLRPKGIVLFLGILCAIFYMSDGVVLDWGALFMMSKGSPAELAGLAFSVFSVAIAIGRLVGDRLVERLGIGKVIVASGIIAILGFGIILGTSGSLFPMAGFCIAGLGVSNLIPILFSYISQHRGLPVSQAISTVTTIGYLGLMAGPPAMGYIAHQYGLYAVFGAVAFLVIAGAAAARKALH